MAHFIGIFLDAHTYPNVGGRMRIHVIQHAGSDPIVDEIPIPYVSRRQDAPDDEWVRDVLVAALEAL